MTQLAQTDRNGCSQGEAGSLLRLCKKRVFPGLSTMTRASAKYLISNWGQEWIVPAEASGKLPKLTASGHLA